MMKRETMWMKTTTNCPGHLIFLAELPSNYVVVENSNKRPFMKVEGWALIRGSGAYSRGGRLFDGALIWGGAWSRHYGIKKRRTISYCFIQWKVIQAGGGHCPTSPRNWPCLLLWEVLSIVRSNLVRWNIDITPGCLTLTQNKIEEELHASELRFGNQIKISYIFKGKPEVFGFCYSSDNNTLVQ